MGSLGNDLAQIRKKRNLTLEDLQEATKIPKRILRSIEDESIFSDFDENPTYIRSYIRGYAKALSIDDEQIIRALDKWEIGAYEGLILEIEGIEPSGGEEQKEEDEEDEEDTKQEEQASSDEKDEVVSDHSPAFEFEEDEGAEPPGSWVSHASSEQSDVHSINWAHLGRQFTPLESRRSRLWLAVIILLVIGFGGFYFFYFNSDSEQIAESQNTTSGQEQEAALSTDSLELSVTPSPEDDTTAEASTADDNTSPIQSERLNTLPDTLDMIIYAAYGRLEPVRVYTDIIGDINPYWIEEGEAMRFDFVNEIRIRGEHDNIVLIMNGHVVKDFREQFYNPDTRLVEINRSYFGEDPKWLQPAPDSLEIDAPAPSVIKERPTF